MTTTPHTTRVPRALMIAIGAIVVAGAALAACSTTEGFGKDVKDLGGSIEESAADNK